jgi:hypothetical protein
MKWQIDSSQSIEITAKDKSWQNIIFLKNMTVL